MLCREPNGTSALAAPPHTHPVQDYLDSKITSIIEHGAEPEQQLPAGMTLADLYNEVALRVARRFDDGTISFEEGDRVVNRLWGAVCLGTFDAVDPDLINQIALVDDVFDAFDLGEYYRRGDDRDPVQAYTVPMIWALVERCRDRP
jgi:hypothetical protein